MRVFRYLIFAEALAGGSDRSRQLLLVPWREPCGRLVRLTHCGERDLLDQRPIAGSRHPLNRAKSEARAVAGAVWSRAAKLTENSGCKAAAEGASLLAATDELPPFLARDSAEHGKLQIRIAE